MSITTVVLSAILAFLLLENLLLLLCYFVSTSIVAATTFAIRISLSRIKTPQQEEALPKTEKGAHGLKKLLLMFLALITFVALPLFMAKVLDPYVWFILFISFITGFSFAEILTYVYTRK